MGHGVQWRKRCYDQRRQGDVGGEGTVEIGKGSRCGGKGSPYGADDGAVSGKAGWAVRPVGFGGGGSDFTKNNEAFGGGAGGGVKVTPICFLIVKDGAVRMMPVAAPANSTADRIVEQVPDLLDKIASFIDSRTEKKAE